MKVIGDTRPYTDKVYYYSMMDNKGKVVKVETWQIFSNKVLLKENNEGKFTFGTSTAGKALTLVGKVKDSKTGNLVSYSISIVPLMGIPKILDVYWKDINGEKITNRAVGYLDEVTLVIKTTNIPVGDRLKVTVYEDEYIDGHSERTSRNMGEYFTKGVTKNGYAYIVFDNIKVYQKKLNDMDYKDEPEHEFYIKVQYSNNKINLIKDDIFLKIKNQPVQMIKPYTGVKPVVVGEVESTKKDHKKPVNFTFGVFFDGTLNNLYNTEIRQKAQGVNVKGLNINQQQAQSIYDKLGDPEYSESSYENDLSNPAILFKNYKENLDGRLFKIYVEGIGTNTKDPKKDSDYKDDDIFQGPAFGMGSAGIVAKVREAIEKIVQKLNAIEKHQVMGTITFDVFGFSRGAAAARHFVHIVTHTHYSPNIAGSMYGIVVMDLQGEKLPLFYKDQIMPRYGLLGQLLQEAGRLDIQTKVEVRFVGIYDTVPHHGLFQGNDIKDLGLDNVNKANYVVHMVAADEHRYNFDLVDISSVSKSKGIELVYPGVHCDVGGSYVEGAPNRVYRIDKDTLRAPIDELRKEILEQGWFYEKELYIEEVVGIRYRLEGYKKKVSAQYSYIPLHIMAEFCKRNNVPIEITKIMSNYNFRSNWLVDNVKFLEKIKQMLWDYSFNGIILNFDNETLKKLRHDYLHWNSSYGAPQDAIGTNFSGKNQPNIDEKTGKRKRDVH